MISDDEQETVKKGLRPPSPYTGSDNSISDLRKQRGVLKGRITVFKNFISKFKSPINELAKAEIKLRAEIVSKVFQNLDEIQSKIECQVPDSELVSQLEQREIFEEVYFQCMASVKCLVKDDDSSDSSKCKVMSSHSNIKLPDIKLPQFDGSYDKWLEFKNSYVTLIHKRTDLDLIQKFHYLRSSITGTASQVISALEFTDSNYLLAWELLENRFHNERLLIHNHVKSLFTMSPMNKESPKYIRSMIDNILRNLRALKSLNEPTETWDTLIIYLVASKFDLCTEREWETYKGTIKSNSHVDYKLKLDDLLTFLRNRADVLEMLNVNHNRYSLKSQDNNTKRLNDYKKPVMQSHTHTYVSTRNENTKFTKSRNCVICKNNHALYTCPIFLNLNVNERSKLVDDNKLCRNCLRSGHSLDDCLFGSCKQCRLKHNSLLHNERCNTARAAGGRPATNGDESADPSGAYAASTSLHSLSARTYDDSGVMITRPVLLSTALVQVADKYNNLHTVRALLDQGSQSSFISKRLCKRLGVNTIQSTVQISGVGQSVSQSNSLCDINIRSNASSYETNLQCLVIPCITSRLPSCPIHFDMTCIPNYVQLADPSFNTPSEVDLLIGADKFWELLNADKIRLPSGPYLQDTKLGWLISGVIYTKNSNIQNHIQCNFTQEIDANLRKFWEVEDIPYKEKVITEDEKYCENLFNSTTKRETDGRFSVRIPLKESAESLGDSYTGALKRFQSLERKLDRMPSYRNLYCDFMREYTQMNHMSEISSYDSSKHYFLPHHGVFRESSSTTKLRVVFDGSSVTSSGKSLNDIQWSGPKLQNDIFSILLRFRQYKYVGCADVAKMFRQVLIQSDMRDLQLILWRDKPSEPIKVYQLNTVTYGTTSAPYLSMRCIRQLAQECDDKNIADVIFEDFFVDDLITGNDDSQVLLDSCNKISEVLASGCFPLRKWTFNFDVTAAMSKDLNVGEHTQNKTLGLGWLNDSDELYFSSTLKIPDSPYLTKRIMLSVISQVYDPLGLLAPVVIIAKALLQQLWLCKLGWDDPVPRDVTDTWTQFISSLSSLNIIRIPRFVRSDNKKYTDLHIFTDASQKAYGACAYVKSYNDDSDIVVHLLCAKSKVAPIKSLSIPRLELCGALIGARLYKKVVESLRLSFNNIFFYSDSTIVIGWLRMSPHLLKSFVQNRVTEINELTGDKKWLHVSSGDNPADLVSRGLNLDALSQSPLWWKGPSFLYDNKSNLDNFIIPDRDLPEIRSKTVNMSITTAEHVIDFDRYSSFNKLKRVGAFVLRFISNMRKCANNKRALRETGLLSTGELAAAETMLARAAQAQSFYDAYRCLSNQLSLKSMKDKLMYNKLVGLNVFLDDSQVIRIGGRLCNSSNFDYNKKHPILLSSKHRLALLLLECEHKRLFHAGPQLLLSSVRECWWIIGARNLAKRVVHQCVTCTRLKGRTLNPIMGNLPPERLEPSFPFNRCGVDFAGPINILITKGRGGRLMKGYICLFVCLVTKAIHLELVTGLSTEDYLLALKRFISRRGKPAVIFSDNGKNFVGAEKELSLQGIEIKFIPPYSPHFGGIWEAGVKACKFHLRRVVGMANLTYEEFNTVLVQIEGILNSRPITPLSSDPDDFLPLTPGHFLVGRPLTAPAYEDITDRKTSLLSRYHRVEQLRQHFWSRWSKEYVSELQQRTKWKTNSDDIKLDSLVVIKEDNMPPLKWRLGRIVRVYTGKDGISRVADIRTAAGVTKRAFSKICPLPLRTEGLEKE